MKTILVVDDEFDILTVWRLLLERHGYAVLTASNGAAALEQIRNTRPDIIVSDCMMPIMSGQQLCAVLNANADLRDIPILLCSAAADIPVQPNPHIEYARKPLSFDVLLQTLQRLAP
ncbi:response regulator [Paraburkholderia bryophila]|jgi:CheY-like chemotaxis protein|uniref:Response regulator receiver domain-containing protein n=1 Tax=Paraburkholderia bryophila TaxID=420952 RepID=A0A329CUT6_9BURK|nr:response regulator [Paraburkholderia bryophila]RAS35444.1 response regulator receiver domain-containing protein [Paraburkholderia bryophila]